MAVPLTPQWRLCFKSAGCGTSKSTRLLILVISFLVHSPIDKSSCFQQALVFPSQSQRIHKSKDTASTVTVGAAPVGPSQGAVSSPLFVRTSVDLQRSGCTVSKLSSDLDRLSAVRPPDPADDFSAPAAIISSGSSYTRLWRPSTWASHQRPPHERYWRHVRRWNASSTARIVLPAVLCSAAYGLVASLSLRHVRIGRYHLAAMAEGASAAVGALAAPLALLLTLRTNASLGRLNEARLLWGRLVLHCRSLAAMLAVHVLPNSEGSAVLAARYLSVMGWALKSLVRSEDPGREEEVYRIMAGDRDATRLMRNPNRPIAITTRLRQIVSGVAAGAAADSSGTKFLVQHRLMESAISDIEAVIGGCERLLSSPIPPTYSRHLSRIMAMYLAVLPIGLVASGIPTLGVTFATAFISYVLIGIDEIGMEIENPFPLLPLQQLAAATQNSVADQILLSSMDLLPYPPSDEAE